MPVHHDPFMPDAKRVALRLRLIQEECKEVTQEFERIQKHQKRGYKGATEVYGDLARLAKELADLRYVIEGAALEFGIPLERVYEEVHESNMSKLGDDGRPIRRADGKVLKGPNYREADVWAVFGFIEGEIEND